MTEDVTIVYHLGAPKPNMDMLTSSLRKDNELMSDHRAMARRPRYYRTNIHTRIMEIEIEGGSEESTQEFLSKLCQKQDLDRLLLSDGNFLAPMEKIFTNGEFYPAAKEHIGQLVSLFPDNPCEFFLEIREPEDFRQEIANILDHDDTDERADVSDVRWSDVVNDIREAAPQSPITIWRHEDVATVWPEVLRAVSGIPHEVELNGDLDQAGLYMPENAFDRMSVFLTERPELSLKQRRHVMSSFLDAVDTGAQPATPSASYVKDLDTIRQIENVTILD